MSTNYTTYQQHEPLRAPSGWSTQEKRFVAQLEELFDDIYKRYNRLRLEDMSKDFRKSFKQIMDDGAELRHDLDITAAGLTSEITRATAAEGTLSSTISSTASAMELTFKKIGASGYTATGITTISENGITVQHSNLNCKTEMSASGFRILNSSNTVIGGIMSLNGKIVTAMGALYNPSFPSFGLEVNRFYNPISDGTTTIDGLQLIYNGYARLSYGMEYDNVTYNIKGITFVSANNLNIVAHNQSIVISNGNNYLSINPSSGIQLRNASTQAGVYVTDTDVEVSFIRYGRVVTLKASKYFQPDD